MLNKDVFVNTFDGGIDLDSDARTIPNNKTREAYNTDIRKSGDVSVISDIKGEDVLSVIDETVSGEIFVLASVDVRFYEEPSKTEKEAILVFYINGENSYKFIIKAFFIESSSSKIIFEEELSDDDFTKLKDSTIDLEVIGQFSYDTVYFVDNRREPRKLECIITNTNELEVTISLNELQEIDNFHRVFLDIDSGDVPTEDFKVFIYGYKKGGATRITPINPATEVIKSVQFLNGGSSVIAVTFDIYEEDYDDWVFQISYHKEGSVIYRNFVIGDPYIVEVPIGVMNNTFLLKYSAFFNPSSVQTDSWDFLYDGSNFLAYSEDDTINPGTTVLYKNRFKKPENTVIAGYYQSIVDGPEENNFVLTDSTGLVLEYETNYGNVELDVYPASIKATAKAASIVDDGVKFRLDGVDLDMEPVVAFGGDDYNLVSIVTGPTKRLNGASYQLERKRDLTPLAIYENETWPTCSATVSFTQASQSYSTATYPLRLGGTTLGNTISFACNAIGRPNRFAIKFNGSIIASTSWLGTANYNGPWGIELPLGNPQTQSISIEYSDLGYYELFVEIGNGDPLSPSTDNFEVTISCPS